MSKKKLELKDVKREFNFSMNRGLSFDWFDCLKNRWGQGQIDFDVWLPSRGMNLQRPFVWDLHQKQQLILSILKDNPIPKICVVQHRDTNTGFTNRIEVIDGKQRLGAFRDFTNGDFCLPTGHYFEDLGKECLNVIYRFFTPSDVAYSYEDTPISDDDKIAWFEQINFTGTPQDAEHLNRLKNAPLTP